MFPGKTLNIGKASRVAPFARPHRGRRQSPHTLTHTSHVRFLTVTIASASTSSFLAAAASASEERRLPLLLSLELDEQQSSTCGREAHSELLVHEKVQRCSALVVSE